MQFNVQLSELAENQYDHILDYIANKLKNPQALHNVMEDFDDTVGKLEKMADSFVYCKNERLKALGLHTIHFAFHKYLFVYRIDGSRVIVEGMYHEMQDDEHSI